MEKDEAHKILIVINGTVGVGKTSVSASLANTIPNALWIEGDALGFAPPDFSERAYEKDHGLMAALHLISDRRESGKTVFVFDRFFENPQKLEWFCSQAGLRSRIFYLSANEEEIFARIRKRARSRAESEILDSKRVLQNQLEMKNRGIEIDTTGKSIEEVMREIQIRVFGDPSVYS